MIRHCSADDSRFLVSPAAMVVVLGGLGGIFYWMTIFPVDAVKSAMQTDDLRKPQRKFPTMASAVKVTPKRVAAAALKGILPALVFFAVHPDAERFNRASCSDEELACRHDTCGPCILMRPISLACSNCMRRAASGASTRASRRRSSGQPPPMASCSPLWTRSPTGWRTSD